MICAQGSSMGAPEGQQRQQQQGVYIDAVSGRHAATDIGLLLGRRGLVWRKDYGWTYDAWVDRNDVSLSGANGRFSLPALVRSLHHGVMLAADKGKDILADRCRTPQD